MAGTPGSLITNPAQTADIASFYVAVTAAREMGFAAAKPQARPMGLLMDMPTSEQSYAVPFGPIRIGRTVLFKDGDRPGARKPQMTILKGDVQKRGVEPIQFLEADRTASRIPIVLPNTRAHGEAEALLEDEQWALALEAGESATQLSYDGVSFFNTQHLQDPADPNSPKQSNLLALDLTPDNYGAAQIQMLSWKAENGMPLYHGHTFEWLLVVPPALAKVAQKIIGREHSPEGGAAIENIEYRNGSYMVCPFLTSSKNWYLFVKNAGFAPVWRMVHRGLERWDLGPNSALYQKTKAIEFFSDEWTDYRMTAWPTGLKSKP